jgi:hypothetical protein
LEVVDGSEEPRDRVFEGFGDVAVDGGLAVDRADETGSESDFSGGALDAAGLEMDSHEGFRSIDSGSGYQPRTWQNRFQSRPPARRPFPSMPAVPSTLNRKYRIGSSGAA